ncbi:hypothetical protein GCM10027290_60170 [Micromonospora sonneratiae]
MLAVAGVFGATLLAACAPTVTGVPRAGAYTPDLANEVAGVERVDLRKDFADSPQSVNDYWTKDRTDEAEAPPLPKPDGNTTGTEEEAVSVTIHPTTGALDQVPPSANGDHNGGQRWSKAGLSGRTVGRLYFTLGGRPYVCSAAVVNSKSGRIVATAGHCLFGTGERREWVRQVMFVPGDEAGKAPHGRWSAETGFVTKQFMNSAFSTATSTSGSGWQFDTAFLRMRPLNGKTIQQALGAQGIAFGHRPEGLMVLGYPSAKPFDGKSMRYCSASSTRTHPGVHGDYGLPCVMTPGCSGGPWLTRFDPVKGAGYVVSTSSVGDSETLYGSTMGKTAYDLYLEADK